MVCFINFCSGRKVSGRLNFDVVSDFVVAGTLQDGNSASSSTAAPTTTSVAKAEQPEP